MNLFTPGLLIFSLLIGGCCGKSLVDDSSTISVQEINCWLNLMPGGTPSFHYSGTIAVERKFSEKFIFSAVKVFYKDEMIHQSQPILQFYDETITDSSSVVRFHFYSQQGIKVTETMMRAESVDFILSFDIENKSFEKKIFEVQVVRAY